MLAAKSIQKQEVYFPISIEQALKKAKKIIKQNGEQEPEIVYSSGNLQVPLALYIKSETKVVYSNPSNYNKPRRLPRKQSSNSGVIAFGLLLLGIALIANDSD